MPWQVVFYAYAIIGMEAFGGLIYDVISDLMLLVVL